MSQIESKLSSQQTAGIMDKSICVDVSFSKPGATRKVKIKKRAAAADQPDLLGENPMLGSIDPIRIDPSIDIKRVSVSKKIINAKEYKAILEFDRSVKAYLGSIAVPSMFKPGVWLIPNTLVDKADAFLQKSIAERLALVQLLKIRWAEIVEESRQALGPLFIASEFASVEELEAMFDMTVNYVSYGVSDSLKDINREIWVREKEKAEQEVIEATAEIQVAMRTSMAELVDYAQKKLTDNEDGRPRVFVDRGVTKMQEFLSTFFERNSLTGDGELEALALKAKALIEGVDASTLKDNQGVRQQLADGFAEVKKSLDGMIEVQPVRRFRTNFAPEVEETAEVG